ncbi:similar to Saccharomyces cerevisiae YJL104W PAM16 Constituent of the import motor (PAM complex) component of the Translocase of the Inner Mitochondrial membrane (TIM23 complex) [Maudiozyma barnettii]|uniref:Mitochondrial import inner membrane translocase subunit TIM16 n=1 Tax=Maudiozyma barnettii TaxID=61262 RepID=A0A8H2VKC9_9SACH|nr:import motor complex subunit PAM16 [Kazachstania barnettii]CAB4256966.1 similar to Saccharomyces cerevisiae YJL104W PAM16 Constituent of the import motor (PAM complex) component of the Translocase of the Inner Mitochondrial membrane (TIM23 complex) [Kazachstania barnettii]CAD1785571.1 similar to Saccharomyces cerevisiae YJL104W PAM16 Constituent of the import motor (PAM complex) component of the Translocase of the Inner Mitochondrial membrane (TIM23 complex) [Kazachstania barnettii]
MAHRAFVQVIITGAQVFGRAFGEAYRQAASQSVKQGATETTRGRGRSAKEEYGGITLDESCKILNIEPSKAKDYLNLDKVNSRFDYLFNINDKEKGGSFYLQSKIYRAAERLKWEIKEREKEANIEKEEASASTSPPPHEGSKDNNKS